MIKDILVEYLQKEEVKGAFLIKDLKDGKTEIYNETLVVPSASLIKMYVMIRVFTLIKENQLTLNTEIPIEKEDMVAFSVLEFLKARSYTLEELLKLMIVYSDNTATNVLIDYLGMEQINHTIKTVDCNDSALQRKMMDFDAAKHGKQNYTTVNDMASLLERLYENKLLGEPYDQQMLEIMKGQADEEMMRRELPDEITIARKSGELDALDHDIAIVYTDKRDYIYVFFSWDAGDNNHARDILARTSKMVFDHYMTK